MPSPNDASQIPSGPGKIHTDVVTAAADLYIAGGASGGSGGVSPDILSQTLASPNTTAVFTANGFSGDTTLLLSNSTYGPFWVGSSPTEPLDNLFKVVNDADDTEVFNQTTHSYVQVSALSTSVGGGFHDGDVTLTFSPAIPPSVQYRVYYGRQAILSALPKEYASFPAIRRAANRARFPEFSRTGLAPTSVATPLDIANNPYPDPLMAQWKALIRGTPGTLTAQQSGSAGFVYVGRKKNVNDANDVSLTGHQSSAFLAVYEKEITSATLATHTVLTKIDPSLSALVNPTGTADVVQLNLADYFRVIGPDKTALRCGVDMLEITFFNGLKEVFIISSFDATDVRRAHLITLGGATASFPSSQSVNVRWIRPGMFLGGDTDSQVSSTNYYKGFSHLVAGSITDTPDAEIIQEPPFFAAGTVEPARSSASNNSWNIKAFTWGGYNQTGASPAALGQRQVNGELWGDGSIQSYGGRIVGLHSQRSTSLSVSANLAYSWNPSATSCIKATFSGSTLCVLTLTLSGSYTPFEGDEVSLFVFCSGDAGSQNELSTITWPTAMKFSGNDSNIVAPTGSVIKFTGKYMGSFFYMTRTDYQP